MKEKINDKKNFENIKENVNIIYKNPINTTSNQNNNREKNDKEYVNQIKNEVNIDNHLYKSYNIYNQGIEKKYNNMKNEVVQNNDKPHSDIYKIGRIPFKPKLVDSNENIQTTNVQNTFSEINSSNTLHKNIDVLPVQITLDKTNISDGTNSSSINGDNYCKTCCKVWKIFCIIFAVFYILINIILLILYIILMILSIISCNCEGFSSSLENLKDWFDCLKFDIDKMVHFFDFCKCKCKCCYILCNC